VNGKIRFGTQGKQKHRGKSARWDAFALFGTPTTPHTHPHTQMYVVISKRPSFPSSKTFATSTSETSRKRAADGFHMTFNDKMFYVFARDMIIVSRSGDAQESPNASERCGFFRRTKRARHSSNICAPAA
jgi:hypothetical protein